MASKKNAAPSEKNNVSNTLPFALSRVNRSVLLASATKKIDIISEPIVILYMLFYLLNKSINLITPTKIVIPTTIDIIHIVIKNPNFSTLCIFILFFICFNRW